MCAQFNRDLIRRTNFRDARLLVIEDNPDHQFIMQKAARQCLPEVELVMTANEAQTRTYLETCLREGEALPKLILLDLYLPTRQHGWQLLDQLKSMGNGINKLPVVLLSNSNNPADIDEAYQRGCSSYSVKPLEYDHWLTYFGMLRTYWWETVTLPKPAVSMF